ncbi:MAG: HEPN domain-containing protein [Chloroflexota bacterium]
MTSAEIPQLLNKAEESHAAAKVLIDRGFIGFSAAQSYYTIFYLVEALLLSRGLRFSSHSALIASYGKEFAKTQILDPRFHQYIVVAQKRRQTGHYTAEPVITDEQALESFQWAEEFMEAVKSYLSKS